MIDSLSHLQWGDLLALLAISALQSEMSASDSSLWERNVLAKLDTSLSPSVQLAMPGWSGVPAPPVLLVVLLALLENLAMPAFPALEGGENSAEEIFSKQEFSCTGFGRLSALLLESGLLAWLAF